MSYLALPFVENNPTSNSSPQFRMPASHGDIRRRTSSTTTCFSLCAPRQNNEHQHISRPHQMGVRIKEGREREESEHAFGRKKIRFGLISIKLLALPRLVDLV